MKTKPDMKKAFRVLGFFFCFGFMFTISCFANLKIQESDLASGKVTWSKEEGADKYILEESKVGPNGPWEIIYSGTDNFCAVSGITRSWYRVRCWKTVSNDHQIPEWSDVVQYIPPGLFIKIEPLKNGYVEWPSIPQANFYEVQTAPKEDGIWDLVYSGPFPDRKIKAMPDAWYRVRALQKKENKIVSITNWSNPQAFCPSAEGFLRTSGTVIKDQNGNGKEILLRGVNLGSLFLIEPWILGVGKADDLSIEDEWSLRGILNSRFGSLQCQQILDKFYNTYIQTIDMDYLLNLGINTIRLPIYYRLLQHEDGTWVTNSSGQIDFSQIDRLVNDCADRGIYVLLDLHGAPGAQNKERHSGRKNFNKLFDNSTEGETYRKRTIELWQVIAQHYKNNKTICGYDLLNEPAEPKDSFSKEGLWKLYDLIYKAIRNVDKNHMIIMEGIWDWEALPSPASMGWENVIYQFHYYHVLDNKELQAQKDFIDQKIREGRIKQSEYQVPVMIGEFTCLSYAPTWAYYLENFNREKWSWTLWTYKSYPSPYEWGLLNYSGPKGDLPEFKTDSFDSLLSKLSNYATLDHYLSNDTLVELIKNYSIPSTSKPFIKNVSPETIQPGHDLWIKGMNFGESQQDNEVMFERVPLPIISWSNTAIHVSIPETERRPFGMVLVKTDKIDSNEIVLHLV